MSQPVRPPQRRLRPRRPGLGELLAVEVGLALAWSQHDETLHRALSTRTIIGHAVGIVM
jgi:hypothetical protein